MQTKWDFIGKPGKGSIEKTAKSAGGYGKDSPTNENAYAAARVRYGTGKLFTERPEKERLRAEGRNRATDKPLPCYSSGIPPRGKHREKWLGIGKGGPTARDGIRGEWESERPQAYLSGVPMLEWHLSWLEEAYRVLKPGGFILTMGGSRTYHWLAAAIELTGFEVRDSIDWWYGCLSEDTEVLTSRGWLHYSKLEMSDRVLQWDYRTEELTWTHPRSIHVYTYRGPMVNLKNRNTDQLLTPNHRVYARITRHSRNGVSRQYECVKAKELRRCWQVNMPLAGKLDQGILVSTERAYLIGWWLTDAWKHRDGKAIMFSQSKPHTLKKLRDALKPYKYSEYLKSAKKETHNDEHTFYVTGELAEYMLKNHPNRELEWGMLSWSYESRLALIRGLLDGDGTIQARSSACAFWSKSKERRDIFMALCVSLGWRCHDDPKKWCVYLNTRRDTSQIQHIHRDSSPSVDYDGKVWCVKVPKGAFVARRNGKPFITGNSGFPKSLDVGKAIGKIAPEQSEKWKGYGLALKPAKEIICVGRKPLEKGMSVARNVLKWGTGGMNVSGCRIGTRDSLTGGAYCESGRKSPMGGDGRIGKALGMFELGRKAENFQRPSGRWPANTAFSHSLYCKQIGTRKGKSPGWHTTGSDGSKGYLGTNTKRIRAISAEEKSERIPWANRVPIEEVWECVDWCPVGILERQQKGCSRFFKTIPISFLYTPKPSKREKDSGCPCGTNRHPTCKPVALFEYLVRLVCPPGGLVLDPFCGSGTTGIACVNEGKRFLGIEQDSESVETAKGRINHACLQPTNEKVGDGAGCRGSEKYKRTPLKARRKPLRSTHAVR